MHTRRSLTFKDISFMWTPLHFVFNMFQHLTVSFLALSTARIVTLMQRIRAMLPSMYLIE